MNLDYTFITIEYLAYKWNNKFSIAINACCIKPYKATTCGINAELYLRGKNTL